MHDIFILFFRSPSVYWCLCLAGLVAGFRRSPTQSLAECCCLSIDLFRSLALFRRKAATAAAVSAVVSAAASGPASALGWGKGKVPEVPDVPSIERQVEQLAAAAEAVEVRIFVRRR